MQGEILSIDTAKKIAELEKQRQELINYIEKIDDRNSIKLQLMKVDMKKILGVKNARNN